MTRDEWFNYRSYLNHTELGNKIKLILTDDNDIYIKYALQGKTDIGLDFERQSYFERIKDSLNNWTYIKDALIKHAKKIKKEFNPLSNDFETLLNYLSQNDIEWLQITVNKEYAAQAQIFKWIKNVIKAINKVDCEIEKIKNGTADSSELRNTVDELMEIYSGKGYFNYASGN